jgi:hypothetical protein
MTKIYFILGLFVLSGTIYGKIRIKDLKGNRTSNNTDSLYYKTDTIEFIKSDIRIFCNNADWSIQSKNRFNISYCDCCFDPPKITTHVYPQRLKLKDNQITLFVNNAYHDKFEIIEFSDFDYNGKLTKILKLKRLE